MKPDDLDPVTKARIEAEEKYRAQVRGKLRRDAGAASAPRAAPQKSSPAQTSTAPPPVEQKKGLGCGSWLVIGVLLFGFIGIAQQCSGPVSSSTSATPKEPSESERTGSFGYTCEKIVKDNIKAPATAKFPNYFTDQNEGRLIGTFAAGYTWNAYVDAQNSFGANIRTRFTCHTEAGSDTVRLAFDP